MAQSLDDLFSTPTPRLKIDFPPQSPYQTLCLYCIESLPCQYHDDEHFEGMNHKPTSTKALSYTFFQDENHDAIDSNWTDFYTSIDDFDIFDFDEVFVEFECDKMNKPIIGFEQIDPSLPRPRYRRFRQKAYVCDYCLRSFTLKHNVQTHIALYHLGDTVMHFRRGRRFKCRKCYKLFKSIFEARRHQRKVHSAIKIKLHRCEYCQRFFPNSSLLKEHISVQHLKLRPFVCSECMSTFGRRGGLKRHQRMVHSNHHFYCPYEHCSHPGYKCSKVGRQTKNERINQQNS